MGFKEMKRMGYLTFGKRPVEAVLICLVNWTRRIGSVHNQSCGHLVLSKRLQTTVAPWSSDCVHDLWSWTRLVLD